MLDRVIVSSVGAKWWYLTTQGLNCHFEHWGCKNKRTEATFWTRSSRMLTSFYLRQRLPASYSKNSDQGFVVWPDKSFNQNQLGLFAFTPAKAFNQNSDFKRFVVRPDKSVSTTMRTLCQEFFMTTLSFFKYQPGELQYRKPAKQRQCRAVLKLRATHFFSIS